MLAAMTIRALILAALSLVCPATALPLSVQAMGELPGFRMEEAAPYLAAQMGQSDLAEWQFTARDPGSAAPDRIEWSFELLPYAGGGVRQFFPMASQSPKLGARRLVAAQARLYLGGQYQTVAIGQEAVQGGDGDAVLATFIAKLTRALHSAWRATDMTPAPHRTAP
ncbi:MAG: hypothetical protein JWP16_1755 [Alphaproteobacteria bacterium]|nr:hypothetical protein [Alphaproteobacteria bacterium]